MRNKLISSVLIMLALTISGCSSSQQNTTTSSGEPPIIDNSGFKNINENDVFEIHTDEQKAFLEYQGDYLECPTSLYPDGTKHLSDSKPITLTWNYELPADKTVEKFSILYGQNKDLSDGYQVDGGAEDTISFNNPYLGRNYYKLTATFTDGTIDETPIRHFEVDSTYPRNLTIAGMTNCRDLGGRVLEDGGKIKQGMIFRTSGKNQNGSLTDATTEEMVNHLKLKNEINLAGDSDSYNLKLTGTSLFEGSRMDTSSYGGYHHFSRNAEAVKNFFEFLEDPNNYPVYYHCKIGTDRTGLCTILLTGLLGVKLNDIYQDYIFSNFGKIGERRAIGNGDSHDAMKYLNDIINFPGEKFQNKCYNILLSIGLSRATLDAVIMNLTEGQNAKGNNADQVIGRADVLTASGVEMIIDDSVRDHPNAYYVLNNDSQSVSYQFTAKKDYNGTVVAYLGNSYASETKKIGDAISCDLDNSALQMIDQTYKQARMGQTDFKNTKRMHYFPVILGKIDISTGAHTIKINGTSNVMNLGGIYIFESNAAA